MGFYTYFMNFSYFSHKDALLCRFSAKSVRKHVFLHFSQVFPVFFHESARLEELSLFFEFRRFSSGFEARKRIALKGFLCILAQFPDELAGFSGFHSLFYRLLRDFHGFESK